MNRQVCDTLPTFTAVAAGEIVGPPKSLGAAATGETLLSSLVGTRATQDSPRPPAFSLSLLFVPSEKYLHDHKKRQREQSWSERQRPSLYGTTFLSPSETRVT